VVLWFTHRRRFLSRRLSVNIGDSHRRAKILPRIWFRGVCRNIQKKVKPGAWGRKFPSGVQEQSPGKVYGDSVHRNKTLTLFQTVCGLCIDFFAARAVRSPIVRKIHYNYYKTHLRENLNFNFFLSF